MNDEKCMVPECFETGVWEVETPRSLEGKRLCTKHAQKSHCVVKKVEDNNKIIYKQN